MSRVSLNASSRTVQDVHTFTPEEQSRKKLQYKFLECLLFISTKNYSISEKDEVAPLRLSVNMPGSALLDFKHKFESPFNVLRILIFIGSIAENPSRKS